MMAGHDTKRVAGGPTGHIPVLLEEASQYLAPAAGGVFIDGTFGNGGYTRAILAAGAFVIAIDRDPDAIAAGADLASRAEGRLTLVHGRYGALDEAARRLGHQAVDGVVLDIGVSSMQIDRAERGFSFAKEGPLDMRMEKSGSSAADLVNTLEPRRLARIISVFGEERKAGLIARAIAAARAERPLQSTGQLAAVIERAIGRRPTDPIHPATRTFQALRIYLNQELEELVDGLAAAERIIREGGRLVVVTFHSLEDRIVKRFLAERGADRPAVSRHLPAQRPEPATFEILTRAPALPGAAEIARNPRARSAKLRAARRTAAPPRGLDPAALGMPLLDKPRQGRA